LQKQIKINFYDPFDAFSLKSGSFMSFSERHLAGDFAPSQGVLLAFMPYLDRCEKLTLCRGDIPM
jgi:hypothetical protein